MNKRTNKILRDSERGIAAVRRILARGLGHVLVVALVLAVLAVLVVHAPPARADTTVNVDDRVTVLFGDMVLEPRKQRFTTQATITNTSGGEILAPVRLVIFDIKRPHVELANPDGLTSQGLPYVEIDLTGEVLLPGESSSATAVVFVRRSPLAQHFSRIKRRVERRFEHQPFPHVDHDRARKVHSAAKAAAPALRRALHRADESGPWWKRKHKRRGRNPTVPSFDFDHAVLAGSSVSLSAPSSNPFALVAGASPTDVAFSVSAVTESDGFGGEVLLQGPGLGNGEPMDDGDGDGVFSTTVAVAADDLAGGDCLAYTASTVSAEGISIQSPVYDLCATGYRIGVVESNTAPDNQVVIDGGRAVADELLVVLERGTSEAVIEEIEQRIGGQVVGTLLPHGLYQLRFDEPLSALELRRLEARVERFNGVGAAGPNSIGEFTSVPNDTDFALLQHALKLVSGDDLAAPTPKYIWDANATGSGITVRVLDSGIDASHPDLAVLPELVAGDNTDTAGHGTEMAGIIGALTDNATGVAAMARNVQLRSYKVSVDLDVTESEMMDGFTRALDLAGPNKVINASFSTYPLLAPTVELCSAIDDLIDRGSVVVNSAGNNGVSTQNVVPGTCNHPTNLGGLLEGHDNDGDGEPNIIATANKPSFIVVAASNCSSGSCATDSLAGFSNSGSWVDIAAPGVNVRTTFTDSSGMTPIQTYTDSTGTSAAAALTSGGVAVLRSCGVASADVFDRLSGGATVAVAPGLNRINLYNSLALPTVNTAPTDIVLSVSTIDEQVDTTGGTVIGDLTTTDTTVCDAHAYSVTGGADSAVFSISGNQLLLDDGVLDFETKSSYMVEVTSTDFYGVATTETFTVTVNDLAEPVIEELVSCGTEVSGGDDLGGDFIDRGFYHPAYPGTSIDQVELLISGRQAGDHTVRLDVRAGTYDGALIATDSQTRTLTAVDVDAVSYVFDLGNAPVTSGSTVTFSLTLEAGPLSPLGDNQVYYAVDSDEHPLGTPDTTPPFCDIDETNGTTPPLDTFRRDGVWVRIDGLP